MTRNDMPGRRSHLRLALLLSSGALLGKVTGFAREIMFARLLGTSFVADSYRGALAATLLPVAPLQADILFSILIPLHRQWNAEGRAPQLFTPLVALFGLISTIIAALVCIFAASWADFVVPGFGPQAHAVTTLLIRVMAAGLPAVIMTACLSCIEISTGRSRITTLRWTVQNVATMVGILALAASGRPVALAISFTFAYWVLLLAGGYLLWREGEVSFRHIRLRTGIAAGAACLSHAKPLFGQPIVDQLNVLIERFAGSYLGVGAISALDYSRTLTDTAQYLVSQPIGYVVLMQGAISGEHAQARVEAIGRPLLAVALPASLCISIFAPEIVQIVYERGVFDAHAVMLTASAVRGIGCSLWAAMLGYILLRMLSAAGRNGMVACCLAAGSAVNIIVNLFVTPHLGMLGLGLGETARGVAVLVGACLILGYGRLITRLLLTSLPGIMVLSAACYGIRQMALPATTSLGLAAGAFTVVALSGMRPELTTLLRRLRLRPVSGGT